VARDTPRAGVPDCSNQRDADKPAKVNRSGVFSTSSGSRFQVRAFSRKCTDDSAAAIRAIRARTLEKHLVGVPVDWYPMSLRLMDGHENHVEQALPPVHRDQRRQRIATGPADMFSTAPHLFEQRHGVSDVAKTPYRAPSRPEFCAGFTSMSDIQHIPRGVGSMYYRASQPAQMLAVP